MHIRSHPVTPRRWFAFLLLGVAAGLTACAGTGRDSLKLPDRIDLESYSFQSPTEENWFIAEQSGDRIALAKQGRVDGETFVIEGNRVGLGADIDPDTLVSQVRDSQTRDLPQPRFRIYQHDVSQTRIDGATCALSHMVTEDRDPGTGTNVATSMLVESVGTVCILPSDPGSAVSLSYTHRSFPEDRDRAFAQIATSLLQTLQFGSAP